MVNFTRTPNQLGNLLGPQIRQPYLPGANTPSASLGWSSPFISGVPNPGSRQPRQLPTQLNIAPAPGMHFIPGVPSPAYRQPRGRQPSPIVPRPLPAFPTPTTGMPSQTTQMFPTLPTSGTPMTPPHTPQTPMTPPYTPQTFQLQQQLQNFMPHLQQFMTMLPQLQQIMSILPQLMNLLNLLGGGR